MKRTRNIALLLAVMVFGFCVSGQAISLTVGSGDYYVNVGDYDYLPYTMGAYPGNQMGALSFQTAMGDYGTWTSMQPFGQVWRPFAAADWRPYTQGHWSYTQYGPTWQGYEPWAWAGYHYGNWVYSQQMGWVWVPGYEWHPGRVAWSHGYDSIGWMPMPPQGYDYSRGYIGYAGPQNQFTYYDDDFSIGFGFGNNDYYYGGPYYDPRYRNMYYNNSFLNLVGLLFTFIEPNYFGNDNYADYYYGGDYARYLFDRRLIRISNRPLDRVFIERVTRQPVQVRQVETRDIQIDGKRVRVVAVEGHQEQIRKHANETVREVIAPAFAEKGRSFKGEKARNRAGVKKALKLENTPERVETVTTEQIVQESRQKAQRREQQRTQIKERKRQEVTRVEKQGRFKEKANRGPRQTETDDDRSRSTKTTPADQQENLRRNNRPDNKPEAAEQERENQKRNNRPDAVEQENQRRNNRPDAVEQEQERRRRPDTEQENIRRDNRPEQERKNRPEQEQENTRRNRPDVDPQENRERNRRPADEEDVRTKDREEQSTVRPETEEGPQREGDKRPEAEVKDTDPDNREKADTKKSNKSKNKKKDKDKDKEQNDEKPPQD